MKILVNPLIEKKIVAIKAPLWRRLSSEQVYRLLSFLSPILALLVWQLISYLQIFPTQILVPPITVWQTFLALLQSGELQLHLKDSLSRLLMGFSIAAHLCDFVWHCLCIPQLFPKLHLYFVQYPLSNSNLCAYSYFYFGFWHW